MCRPENGFRRQIIDRIATTRNSDSLRLVRARNLRAADVERASAHLSPAEHIHPDEQLLRLLFRSSDTQIPDSRTARSEEIYLDRQFLSRLGEYLEPSIIWPYLGGLLRLLELIRMNNSTFNRIKNRQTEGIILEGGDGQDDRRNHEDGVTDQRMSAEESEEARINLIKILNLSKAFNASLIICHCLMLLRIVGLEGPAKILARARLLNLQNIQDEFNLSESDTATKSWHEESTICYFLLLITVMDLANNLFWYHSKGSVILTRQGESGYAFRRTGISWHRSILRMITSPRHLFQTAFLGLFIAAGPLNGAMGLLVNIYNNLNQIVRHCYNLYRVSRYLETLEQNKDLIESDGAGDGGEGGWSNWPLCLHESGCQIDESYLSVFERIQMMSEMLAIKLTIFTLLIHLDSLNFANSPRSLIILACLGESYLAMHSYYDKYYHRYCITTTC